MNGFEFDMIAFLSAGKENAGAVIFLVLVLTYVAGLFGAKGKVQLVCALVIGALLGAAFQVASVGTPVDFTGWFWLVIYALVMAVLPVGAYEFGKNLIEKAAKLATAKLSGEAAEKVSQALGNQPLGRG